MDVLRLSIGPRRGSVRIAALLPLPPYEKAFKTLENIFLFRRITAAVLPSMVLPALYC